MKINFFKVCTPPRKYVDKLLNLLFGRQLKILLAVANAIKVLQACKDLPFLESKIVSFSISSCFSAELQCTLDLKEA